MSKHRPKSRRRKNKVGRPIAPVSREEVVILKEMGLTLREICDKTLLGYGTVAKIIKDTANEPDVIRLARAEALERASGVAMGKAVMAFDHLTPESMTHDRVEERDADGNLVRVHHSGATGQQIATTGGIMMDQTIKLQKRAEELRDGRKEELSPETIKALIDEIGGQIKRIKILDVEFDSSAIEEKLAQAEVDITAPIEADYEEIVDPDEE